jgi:hypothetical protein
MPDRDTKFDLPIGPIRYRKRRNSHVAEPYFRLGNLEIEDNMDYLTRATDAIKRPG